jgi:hypothetical protein
MIDNTMAKRKRGKTTGYNRQHTDKLKIAVGDVTIPTQVIK